MDAQQSEQTESQAWADVLRHKQRQRQQRAAEKADAAWSQLRSDEALLEWVRASLATQSLTKNWRESGG